MTPASLITWRTSRGLSKTGAAEALGLSRNTYAAYEAGRYPVPVYIALACAAIAYGLPAMP